MGTLIDIPKRIWANETFRMLFIAAGIMICFLYFGVMQEKIMRGCFGGEITDGKCENGGKSKSKGDAPKTFNFLRL